MTSLQDINIEEDSNANSLSGGKTLSDMLREAISDAEELLGKSTFKHKTIRITLHPEGPRTIPVTVGNEVILEIQLGLGIGDNEGEMAYQLGHEAVHCVAAREDLSHNTSLEEGLATFVSLDFARKHGANYIADPARPNYFRAYNAVNTILNSDKAIIRKAREELIAKNQDAHFSSITLEALPEAEGVADLFKPFPLT